MDVDAGEEGGDDGLLRVQEIDAYWLQRRIASALGYSDADAAKSQVGLCWGCSLAYHFLCVEGEQRLHQGVRCRQARRGEEDEGAS